MPNWMVSVSAFVNLPLHHEVQKFSSGTSSPGWSRKKGRKTVVMVYITRHEPAAVLQSTVCEKIVEALGQNSKNVHKQVAIISQECFYRELDDQQRQLAIKGQLNFDHPGMTCDAVVSGKLVVNTWVTTTIITPVLWSFSALIFSVL